jgi:hypothetical protein
MAAITVARQGQSLLLLEKMMLNPKMVRRGEEISMNTRSANWKVTAEPPALKLLGDAVEIISQIAGIGHSA